MNSPRASFLILGVFFIVLVGLTGFAAIMAESPPAGIFYVTIAMAVVSFSMAYLYPQFIQKDERMKLIRQKGTMASFFAMIIYFLFFTTALQFNWIDAPAYYLFQVFGALMISTVFISFVIYARLY